MADTDVTAQTVIDNSIARAKDANKTQWADAQLLKFLNKAVDYLHRILIRENNEIAINDGTITLVASTQEYTLSGNLDDFWGMAPNGVYFSNVVKPLTPVTHEDQIREGSTTTDTDPKSYYVTATKLGLVNTPSATSVATYGTLNCRFFKKNTTLSLTDNMPYKNILNEPIVSFMDSMAMVKAEVPAEEITAIFNALEQSSLEILARRVPA